MRLGKKPTSLNALRKNSRHIMEKFKDLYRPRKFQKILLKKNIAHSVGKTADIQITIDYISRLYECYLLPQQSTEKYPRRKEMILYNHLKNLNAKISESCTNNKPINRKYVSNVLKAQTIFFNNLHSKKVNIECDENYNKFILSAISVWNNDWDTI